MALLNSKSAVESSSPIRLHAIVVGVVLCCLISVGIPYGEFVIKGTRLGLSSSTPAAFFLLFWLVLLVQPLLGLVRRSWLFTRAELLLINVMMMLTTAIPSRGFTGAFLPAVTSVFYYAAPENNWAEILVPHIPTWMVPHDMEAIRKFYEGLPRDHAIPWGAWLEPVGWWFLFMGAFYMVLVCSMVLIRRQWMEHERLLYPLVQVPLSVVEDKDPPARLKPLLKNPVVWMGFAVPAIINSITAFSRYYEFVGSAEISLPIRVASEAVTIPIRVNYLMIGLAYFINTGISFSLWFFYLLAKTQEAVSSILGIYTTEQLDAFSHTGPTTGMLSHQSMGAMIVLAILGLWTARPHLCEVWQHVWGRGTKSDGDELISYRGAAFGMLVGLGIMSIWLWRSGLPAWAVPLCLLGIFAIFFALTRVVVEAGLSAAVAGVSGAGFLVSGVGSTALGPAGVLATRFTLVWAGDLLVFMMAPCAHGIRMLHGLKSSRKLMLGMMAVALAIGLAGSVYMALSLAYRYGAFNLHSQYFVGTFAQGPFRFASRFIENPTGPYWPGWGWTGVGAAFTASLMLAQHRLLWWPFHPIGYVVSGTWILNTVWINIFLAWLFKTLVLKYTGPAGYRATRWFFLGMVLGQIVVGGSWLVVDAFTGMKGNYIRMY